jgi:DNA-binding response OmpR family regulator
VLTRGDVRILVVDADPDAGAALVAALATARPDLQVEGITPDAAGAARLAAADVVVWGLAEAVGQDLVDRLVVQASAAILLIGAGPPPAGLPWLAKPVRVSDLAALVDGVQSRTDRGTRRIGPYRFDAAAKLLVRGEKRIRLTEKEAALLHYLSDSEGAVARERLLSEVWGYATAADTHTLETLVYRLRRKIEQNPSRAVLLVTEPGGYRLVR